MAPTLVRTTYLEMTDPARLVPARDVTDPVAFVQAREPNPAFNRSLYAAVGAEHFWLDRIGWSWAEWHRLLADPRYETWYLTVGGTPAGYGELDARRPPDVEIAYFGLLPAFIGRGFGGWLLDRAIRRGFELGTRVWVNTNTLDGANALPAYRRRGLVPYREVERQVELPTALPEPWPGAARERSGT